MKQLLFLLMAAMLWFTSCQKAQGTREDDESRLAQLKLEIITMAASKPCTNESEWSIMKMKSLMCNGTIAESFAYHQAVDKVGLQRLIAAYEKEVAAYFAKWKPAAVPCPMIIEPSGVICVDGKPKMVYGVRGQPGGA